MRRRRRGCRAGAKQRAKSRRNKSSIPVIIMGNVIFLGNETDEVVTLLRTQWEYHGCSIMSFTETWLHLHVPDQSVEVPDFSCVGADGDVDFKW